jgi:hypothetical protein
LVSFILLFVVVSQFVPVVSSFDFLQVSVNLYLWFPEFLGVAFALVGKFALG